MYELTIPAMRSEHCTQGTTRAVATVASCARVGYSHPGQVVKIGSVLALATLVNANDAAGYPVAAGVEPMPHHVHHCDQCDV